MSNDSKSDVFKKIDSIVRRDKTGMAPVLSEESPIAAITQQADEISQKKLDLIGRIKGSTINRKAYLEELRALHDAHLEAGKHALRRAVDVEKARVDTIANRYIFQITEEYLGTLRDLGLQNFDSRMQTLLQLNTTMADLLRKAEAQDVPDSIKEITVENIYRKYKEFSDKLMEEELKLT